MAGQVSRENGKKGGRPPGTKNQVTLEKEAALKQFQERVRAQIDPLFDSQFTLARGMTYLFRIDEEWEGKVKRKKHVLVTNPDEIGAYLDSQLDEVDDDGDDVYYYITTKDPDNHALDSLLDRTFGKSAQVMLTFRGNVSKAFATRTEVMGLFVAVDAVTGMPWNGLEGRRVVLRQGVGDL